MTDKIVTLSIFSENARGNREVARAMAWYFERRSMACGLRGQAHGNVKHQNPNAK
jgi:hypothetical protein